LTPTSSARQARGGTPWSPATGFSGRTRSLEHAKNPTNL
jgi:hypothetical protein